MAEENMQASEEKSLILYLRNMQKIKWRVNAIKDIVRKNRSTTYPQTNTEFCVLQIRKILELIAFSSLVSDADIYRKKLSKIEQMWNARLILKDIERIHPNFYPRPISINAEDQSQWDDLAKPYLTRDQFESIYDKCGKYLHEISPFKTDKQIQEEYDEIQIKITEWLNLIIHLLNTHIVYLYNEKKLLYISMGGEDNRPNGNVFHMVEEENDQDE